MSQSERGGKHGQPIELEFEIIKIAKISAFDERLVAMQHDAKLGLDQAVVTHIADAHHQGRPAVQGRDDGRFTEQDAGNWSRESNEDETSHDGEEKYSAHDLDSRDDVAVQCLRIPMAVTDGGQGLDAEKERVEKWTGPYSENAVPTEHKKRREDEIEHDVNGRDERGKLRPGQTE